MRATMKSIVLGVAIAVAIFGCAMASGTPVGWLVKNRKATEDADVQLVEIIPSENIGGAFDGWQGVFDASPDTAKRLIDLGREDAEEKLKERKAY